jgi:hypothetical protein
MLYKLMYTLFGGFVYIKNKIVNYFKIKNIAYKKIKLDDEFILEINMNINGKYFNIINDNSESIITSQKLQNVIISDSKIECIFENDYLLQFLANDDIISLLIKNKNDIQFTKNNFGSDDIEQFYFLFSQ